MPFNRFKTIEEARRHAVLGPEMRSTGEVMGLDAVFGTAFAKAQTAAYGMLPMDGKIFVSMANVDKRHMIFPIKRLADLGYEILATAGTAEVLRRNGVETTVVRSTPRASGLTASRLSWAGSSPARSSWSSTRHTAPPRAGRRGSTATRSAPPRC